MHRITGGVWPAMFTPLSERLEPDFDVVDQLVGLFVDQQMDGLYILGSTGQGPAISLEARKAVAEHVVRSAAGRLPVMVHVGCIATADSIALARHAAEIGADAVSSVPPIYFPANVDAVFEHFRRIGAATDLPFFPYHAGFLQTSLPPAKEYARRVLQIPHVAGMKITEFNPNLIGLLQTYSEGRLTLFSGQDETLCHMVLSGAAGAIGTFYNLFGPACRRAWRAFREGDVDAGRLFMLTFQEVIDRAVSDGSMYTFLRQGMRIEHGIDIGPSLTPPAAVAKPWEDEDVRTLLDRVNVAAPMPRISPAAPSKPQRTAARAIVEPAG